MFLRGIHAQHLRYICLFFFSLSSFAPIIIFLDYPFDFVVARPVHTVPTDTLVVVGYRVPEISGSHSNMNMGISTVIKVCFRFVSDNIVSNNIS